MNLKEINTVNLKAAILEVVENPSYKDNAKLRSRRFRAQPIHPLGKAIWWIEYILADPNPSHILSPAMEMNVFAALTLDVLAVFVIAVVVIFWIVLSIALKFFRYFMKPKENIKLKVT